MTFGSVDKLLVLIFHEWQKAKTAAISADDSAAVGPAIILGSFAARAAQSMIELGKFRAFRFVFYDFEIMENGLSN